MTCNVGTARMVIAVWVVAGLLSLAGALVYAELAAMMPSAGGDYGWTRFFVASAGGLAGLAAGFAIFLNVIAGGVFGTRVTTLAVLGYHLDVSGLQVMAIASIAVVTAINCAAITVGGRIASVLAALKSALVVGVGVGAMLLARGTWAHFALTDTGGACEGVTAAARGGFAGFGAAMLGALWAYNGWADLSFVAEEVRDPGRTLPRATILASMAL